MYSNWRAEDSFDNLLKKERLVGISKIDTRRLTVNIRDRWLTLTILFLHLARMNLRGLRIC
jgi:carbamoylphosphate synthase small subunit